MAQPQQPQETEELIKSNKSMAQQNLDLRQEVNDLKIQLRRREFALMAIQNALNGVFAKHVSEGSMYFKDIVTLLSNMSSVGATIQTDIQNEVIKINRYNIPSQIQQMSDQLRQSEGLQPLVIENETPAETGKLPGELNSEAQSAAATAATKNKKTV